MADEWELLLEIPDELIVRSHKCALLQFRQGNVETIVNSDPGP
jgi:hypothetical protein